MKRRTRPQERTKRLAGKCALCPQTAYHALQAHRVVPGVPYARAALLALCASCHALHHAGSIRVVAVRPGTGAYVGGCVHWIDARGRERFTPLPHRSEP